MPLDQFLDDLSGPSRSLVVANRTEPEPLQRMIEKLFDDQDVAVGEADPQQYDDNTVLLMEEGNVVATSPLKELEESILMINSDLFITGTRDFQNTGVPDVIDGLAEVPFTLAGYPASDTEKLLLILLSRRIERLAYETGFGTLRSSFQRLSRIEDEKGTRETYETIAETDVDVHVYGRPDWTPTPEFGVTMHGGYSPDFEQSWFVVFNPETDTEHDGEGAALLAIEVDTGTWKGFWTYDQSLVGDIATHIRKEL